MTIASAIYEGRVTHHRRGKVSHDLSYSVWYLLADIDELETLDTTIGGFGNERRSAVSFHARDHGPRDGSPLRPWIERQLDAAGIDLQGGPIRILSFPRIWGYAFNPISVWFCHDKDGDLRALLFEVSNTFGEWHHYLSPVDPGAVKGAAGAGRRQQLRTTFAKELFVSPFMTMDATYDIVTGEPGQDLALAVSVTTGEGRTLSAAFRGRRVPLTTRSLRHALLRHPLLTFKVIAGIHWDAIKLWTKGAPYRRRGLPPTALVSVVAPARAPQAVAT